MRLDRGVNFSLPAFKAKASGQLRSTNIFVMRFTELQNVYSSKAWSSTEEVKFAINHTTYSSRNVRADTSSIGEELDRRW